MALHFSHVKQRGIQGIDQDALVSALVEQPFVRDIVFHIAARKLIHAGTHGHAAVVDIKAAVRQVQGQGQINALDILAQGLCNPVSELDSGQLPVHLDDNRAVVSPLQVKDQFRPVKHRTVVQKPDIL